MIDLTALLGTSPPSSMLNCGTQILSPGELIRTSGKFVKPTKIPGKNYSKDEVVIRNADSGKGTKYNIHFKYLRRTSYASYKKVREDSTCILVKLIANTHIKTRDKLFIHIFVTELVFWRPEALYFCFLY